MTNTSVYELIQKQLEAKPDAPVAKLCRVYKASYSGFRYWQRKQLTDAKVVSRNEMLKVPTPIKISDLVSMYLKGQSSVSLTVNVLDMVTNLEPNDLQKFIAHIAEMKKHDS